MQPIIERWNKNKKKIAWVKFWKINKWEGYGRTNGPENKKTQDEKAYVKFYELYGRFT